MVTIERSRGRRAVVAVRAVVAGCGSCGGRGLQVDGGTGGAVG